MEMETKIDQILKIVTMLQQDFATLKKDFQELKEKDVAKLNERVTSLERSVALIEFEHGEKLSALFDYIEVNKDEHKKLEDLSLSIKSEIQGALSNHERRITNLEGNLVPSF